MTNYELWLEFHRISALNIFDAQIELKLLKKKYKKSDFYKQTRYSFNKAYSLFVSGLMLKLYYTLKDWTDVDMLGIKLSQVIENIDTEKIQEASDKIIKSLEFSKLNAEKGELQNTLAQIKSIL